MNFAEIFGRVAGSFQQGSTGIFQQVQPWVMRLLSEAPPKWLPMYAAQVRCEMSDPNSGKRCSEFAITRCINCGGSVCLGHSFVDNEGDAVCFRCIGIMVGRSEEERASHAWQQKQEREREYQRSREQARQGAGPGPGFDPKQAQQQAYQQAQIDIAWARGVLGLSADTPWEDIKAKHKKLSKDTHPDRSGGSENAFKDVQRAFEIMKKVHGKD